MEVITYNFGREKMPINCQESIVVPIHKKCGKEQSDNSVPYKVISKVISASTVMLCRRNNRQTGLMKG